MGILLLIDDGVYVCICRFNSDVYRKYTPHAFVYDSHFVQLYNIKCCVAIIDIRSYAPIFVLEVKNKTSKATLKNVLWKLTEGVLIVCCQ